MKRLFIGIPIVSEIVVQSVKSWKTDQLLKNDQLNWVNPENWHITLFFLGNQPKSAITLLQQIIEESFYSVPFFNTLVTGAGVFLRKRDPKVLWLGLDNIALLLTAYTRMGDLLQQNRFAFDYKPLKPHLTVARIKNLQHNASFESFLSQNQRYSFGPVGINSVVLYESTLNFNGSVYNPLFVKLLAHEPTEY